MKVQRKNPFPNEHAARQTEPDKRRYKTYRRKEISPGISFIYGIKKSGGTEIQSIRFDKTKFTPIKAKSWLKKHKFKTSQFTTARKLKKNPHKPLDFYIKEFNQHDFILPKNITEEESLIISKLYKQGFTEYKKVGKYKDGEIYICYLNLSTLQYLCGIIELYPDHIEYHTFDNNIQEIEINNKTYDKENVLKDLNNKLFKYFIENI